MDLPWGADTTIKFVTNIGFITTDGPHGPDVMAAEWTYLVSYRPGLIAIGLGPEKATLENIRKSREFGVSLASPEQYVMSSVSGTRTARDTDKIAGLKELGFTFYPGKRIKALIVAGAALNAECTLVKEVELGDHILIVGEVVEAKAGGDPLVYHNGRYWKLTTPLERPSTIERARIFDIIDKHQKT